MEGNKMEFKSIDEYISQFPPDVQEKLKMLRKVIKEAAPDAEEKISYQMPAFAFHDLMDNMQVMLPYTFRQWNISQVTFLPGPKERNCNPH